MPGVDTCSIQVAGLSPSVNLGTPCMDCSSQQQRVTLVDSSDRGYDECATNKCIVVHGRTKPSADMSYVQQQMIRDCPLEAGRGWNGYVQQTACTGTCLCDLSSPLQLPVTQLCMPGCRL